MAPFSDHSNVCDSAVSRGLVSAEFRSTNQDVRKNPVHGRANLSVKFRTCIEVVGECISVEAQFCDLVLAEEIVQESERDRPDGQRGQRMHGELGKENFLCSQLLDHYPRKIR